MTTAYDAALAAAAWIPLPRDLVIVRGRHRERFLHAMLSNSTKTLRPGQGVEAALCSIKGRAVAELRVLARENDYLLDMEAGLAESFVPALLKYRVGEKVKVEPAELASGYLVGPQAAALAGLPAGSPWEHTDADGIIAVHTAWMAVPCVQLIGPAEALTARVETLGVPTGDEELFEVLRLEAGTPRFGRDFDERTLLLESGLRDRLISFTKGCYPGQEVICRADTRGAIKRSLALLQVDEGILEIGADLLDEDGTVVGRATSTAVSPGRGALALAALRLAPIEARASLSFGEGGRATVLHPAPA